MQNDLVQEYASFMVGTAINLQKGQTLMINSPIETAPFARLCGEVAFSLGAKDVVVHFADEQMGRIRMRDAKVEALEEVKPWCLRSYLDYVEGEGGACVLSISARDPEIYKGLDVVKIDRAAVAQEKAMKPWRELTMAGRIQWSVASVPTVAWATRVFPEKTEQEAMDALWQAIYTVCRIGGQLSPGEAWRLHAEKAQSRIDRLHAMQLEALHLKSANGTDLRVGLAEGHKFAGIQEKSTAGISYLANVPTEEVFTAPHCRRVEGVVKSSLPYVYNGNLIEGIRVRFEAGVAVEYGAEKGDELLKQMMSADEGAKRLGEVALVPASSPVRKVGRLFYNTLFDENAACHIAFGAGYPDTIRGGQQMSLAELGEKGLNESFIHEDIMVGTEDMDITGITKTGERLPVFEKGEWVF